MNKACGIICEYNPFHKGHKYQIEYAKNTLNMPVVCAMSGNYVQRGTPSCMDKWTRSRDAINGGADLVLEIPFPYSSMTAEVFARAGVEILSKSGICSHLLFGSECADVDKLTAIAELLCRKDTKSGILSIQKNEKNLSFARSRARYVATALGDDYAEILNNPNDILGIEYIRAIILSKSDLIPVPMKRTVNRNEGIKNGFSSSTKIRELMKNGDFSAVSEFVPFNDSLSAFVDTSEFFKVLHLSLMTKKTKELEGICEVSTGLEYAIIRAARSSESYEKMVEELRSKALTDSKIRRMLLFAFFGVSEKYLRENVPFTFVLAKGEDETAKELLRMCRTKKSITVAQRLSGIKKDELSRELCELWYNADRLYDLATKSTGKQP